MTAAISTDAAVRLEKWLTAARERSPDDADIREALGTVSAALNTRRSGEVVIAETGYPVNTDRDAANAHMDTVIQQSHEHSGRWYRILRFIADHMPATGDRAETCDMLQAAAERGLLRRIPEVGPKFHAALCEQFDVRDTYDNNYSQASPAAFVLFMRDYGDPRKRQVK